MAGIERHPLGAFCWVELGTTDTAAAKSFYGGLFGWTPDDMPMSPGCYYTMWKLAGLELGAMYKLTADMLAQGVPPNWLLYVNVGSVDEANAKATAAGGQVVAGPFDVGDAGRMSVIRDPQGAVVGLWQPKSHIGIRVAGAVGTLCWSELATSDRAGATAFYSQVFGWAAKASAAAPIQYTEWQLGERGIGGMLELSGECQGAPPNWMPYFLVDDCDQFAEKAGATGGAIIVPGTDIPDVGRFAVLRDPQGAHFAIFQPAAS